MEEEIIKLIAYFLIYSFLGWVLESIFKTIIEKKFVNSGFLIGPFCPIYGFGAVIMYLFLEQVQGRPILAFCLGFVILSAWEYIVGLCLEKIFHTTYWDYSDHKFNLQGRICLENSAFWGLLSVAFIDYIHPFIESQLLRIDINILRYIVIGVMVYLLVDLTISVIKIMGLKDELARIEKLNIAIHEKLEVIKQKSLGIKEIDFGIESIQEALDKLKKQRDKIIVRAYRNVHRLKRAFPTMKSDMITAFLKQRKELIKTEKKK